MTFLLRGEVEAHTLRSKYDQLEIKVETLTKLLLPNNNNNNTHTHNPLYGMGGLGSAGENGTGTGGGINPNFSSLSNYTPSLTTTGQQGGAYEFCPHSVSDLNSTYMSAYISYIKADSAHSGINGPESQRIQGYSSDKKDVNVVAKSQYNSNMTDNNTHYQPYHTLNENQQIRQDMSYTPLPLSPPLYPTPSSKTAVDINNKYSHTNTHTNSNAHANTNNNTNTHTNNGESNPGPTSGTSTSDWLFACTPHKSPITPTTTTIASATNGGQNPGVNATNGGQNPGVNAPQKNIFSPLSTSNYPSSVQKSTVKSEYNVVNSMHLNGGNTKESLGSVKFEYESPSISYTTENVPQTAEGGLSLQRRLFSQPSHFTLPSTSSVGQDVSSTSSLLPLPSSHSTSHHSSNPSSHPYTHTNCHTLSNLLPSSHPLPLSHINTITHTNMNTHTQSITHSTSSTLTKNTESVYDSTTQIHGNASTKPHTDTRAIITKNLAQSFLDVDASLTQIENTRNGYSTYGSKVGEYNMGEKENKFAFNRNTSDKGPYYDGIQVLDPFGHGQHVSPYRATQPLVPTSVRTDTYTAPTPLAGYKGSTGAGGYAQDTPPPPTCVPTSDRHKGDGRTQREKSKAHMNSESTDSSSAREGTHVPQGVYPPNPYSHSHYTASPRQGSMPSTKAPTAPSSSHSRAPTSASAPPLSLSRSQSPSPTPTPTTSHRPSSHTVPHQRSSFTTSTSSSSSTHRHSAVSTDNEQGSMCVPSSNIPLPSAPPNHPFSLKNIENPLLNSITSGSNKPIYDARHGSFSRK
jgi:hypothetical protein